jgi:hypothetical protein
MTHRAFALMAAALSFSSSVSANSGNVVTEWNAIAAQNMTGGNPLPHLREFAILHVAIYDSVMSICDDYQPYRYAISSSKQASAEAAAITAAHDVLVSFHPANSPAFDATYAERIGALSDRSATAEGVAVGHRVASAVLAARALDNFDVSPPIVVDGTLPYQWRRTPPAFADPLAPQFATVTPWVIRNAVQFLPKPPPALESHRYARDLNEIKAVGSVASDVPEDRRDLVRFYLISSAVFWNDVARQLSAESPSDLARTARIFAILNTSLMDSYIGAWYAKFKVYFNWRPITAIRLAGTDSNSRTEPDPLWDAFQPTPAHPTYPSGHAVAAGSASHGLIHFFGNGRHSLTMTSPTAPAVTLRYTRLRDIVDDVYDARIYMGAHFRFDMEAGEKLGMQTAQFCLRNAFGPARGNHDEDIELDDWRP